jgi:alpha-L-fucosidase 2
MNKPFTKAVPVFLILVGMVSGSYGQESYGSGEALWYDLPATEWMQALPVGNGRLGAMIFGQPALERIQLNEDSMWPGAPDWGDSKGDPVDLTEIRRLLKAGRNREADSLIVARFSYKSVLRSHQTMGDLYIDFKGIDAVKDYSRNLDLQRAVAEVKFSAGGYEHSREVFSSGPDGVLVIRLKTTDPRGMNFDLRLDRPEDQGHTTVNLTIPSDSIMRMKGMVTQFGGQRNSEAFPIDYGVKFDTRLKVRTQSGKLTATQERLQVRNAREAVLFIACHTSFYEADKYEEESANTLVKLQGRSYEEIMEAHLQDYGQLYERVSLDLGGKELNSIATDRRLERFRKGEEDPGLAALLFQYGRYLLISSSRPGTNPANLQGLWNEHIEAPWNADYHLNINLQMNYWLADLTGLSELHRPYFDFIDRVLERGRTTAREQYGMSGSVVHHATDLWAPAWMRAERAYWGSWIHGGGWAVQHYWEHFQFSRDTAFLRERAYPAIKSVAEFYMDWLIWDEKLGSWISAPETSPENSYSTESGVPAAVSYGSAMGHQIISEVFDNLINAARTLDISDEFVSEVKDKRENLHPGVLVGEDGRILEWNKPYEEPEPGHRHISHLYALYPGIAITAADTSAFNAAQRTIDHRLNHGGAGTGWSRALMINMNARLLDSTALQQNIRKFMEISVAPNLFDEHPPFQIDGNFGYTAGVSEALLQSHEGFLRILPALPGTWRNGSVKGLMARGAIRVDLQWENGRLKKLGLHSASAQSCVLNYSGRQVSVNLPAGRTIFLDGTLNVIEQ